MGRCHVRQLRAWHVGKKVRLETLAIDVDAMQPCADGLENTMRHSITGVFDHGYISAVEQQSAAQIECLL